MTKESIHVQYMYCKIATSPTPPTFSKPLKSKMLVTCQLDGAFITRPVIVSIHIFAIAPMEH